MKRVEELDFTRVVAMLAVIAIHVTSTFVYADSGFAPFGLNLAFWVNQWSRFAVPLFVLLSGLSLGLGNRQESYGQFLQKRLRKIGLPYLFWFVCYVVYNHRETGRSLEPVSLLRSFFLGQEAPHLYFIVVVFQLYLLYPLLKRGVEKAPLAMGVGSFAVTYAIQKLFFLLHSGLDLIPDVIQPYLWLLFPTWLCYFVWGMLLLPQLARLREWTARHGWAIVLSTALFCLVYTLESKVTGDLGSIRPGLLAYVPLTLLTCFALWPLVRRSGLLRQAVHWLSAHSMTVYFSHVLLLGYLREVPVLIQGMRGMVLLYGATFALSVLLAALLGLLSRK